MLAYILFRDNGITPAAYYAMPHGCKLLLSEFVRRKYGMEAENAVRRIGADEE